MRQSVIKNMPQGKIVIGGENKKGYKKIAIICTPAQFKDFAQFCYDKEDFFGTECLIACYKEHVQGYRHTHYFPFYKQFDGRAVREFDELRELEEYLWMRNAEEVKL